MEKVTGVVITGLAAYTIFKIGQLSGVCKTLKAFINRTDEDKKNDSITVGKTMKVTVYRHSEQNF